jgi:ribosomal protein S18/ribosomal protein S6
MRNYETIIIFKTGATEANVATITKKLEKVISKKPGKVAKKDEWGNKTLAYPIKKEKQGKYVVWHYSQEPKVLAEVDKALRYEEDILRYTTLVADEELEKHLTEKKARKAEPVAPGGEDRPNNRDQYDVYVDYKDILSLSRYISDRGKITPRRISGVSAKSQRRISQAVKRARQIALLSYTDGVYTERPQFERSERPQFDRGERSERGDRDDRGDRGGRGERNERY